MIEVDYHQQQDRLLALVVAGHMPIVSMGGSLARIRTPILDKNGKPKKDKQGNILYHPCITVNNSPNAGTLSALLAGEGEAQRHYLYTVADVDAFIAAHSV